MLRPHKRIDLIINFKNTIMNDLKDFKLEKADLSVIKGGEVFRFDSTTGPLMWNSENNTYYDAIGNVVTQAEAVLTPGD